MTFDTFASRLLTLITLMLVTCVHVSATEYGKSFTSMSQSKYALKREAYRRQDAAMLRDQFYAADARIVSEGGVFISGSNAIYEGYKRLLPTRSDIQITPLQSWVAHDGSLASELARVQATATDPKVELPEQLILFVWRKIGADWRCVVEMSVKHSASGVD